MLLITVIFFECLKVTGGKFIYVLDDTYIHLAYAKNIVLHNVWGVTQYEPSSSSSSPLWTLILSAVFFLSGVSEYVPLILNVLMSFVLIIIIYFIFTKYFLSGFYIIFSILAVIIFAPLAINIFTGMEHLLQTILVILFIFLSVKILTNSTGNSGTITKNDLILFVLAALLSAVRYESLIVIILIAALFFIQKKFLQTLLIIFSGIFPLIIFGWISVNNGGYIVPNSVLMKFILPEPVRIISEPGVYEALVNYIAINKKIIFLFLISVSLLILHIRLGRKFLTDIILLLFIIICVIIIHKISFSLSFFRYDTYLVITCIVINSIALYRYLSESFQIKTDFAYVRKNKIALFIFIVFSFILAFKSFDSKYIITASRNIYHQQYQMSRFLNKYYKGEGVALNDIGAVNFFADIRSVDLMGIGSNEVASRRLRGSFGSTDMNAIAASKNLRIAIVYKSWFEKSNAIPAEWVEAGMWKIQDNFICGDDEVSIFAFNPDESAELSKNLKAFSSELPGSIIQSGKYIQK